MLSLPPGLRKDWCELPGEEQEKSLDGLVEDEHIPVLRLCLEEDISPKQCYAAVKRLDARGAAQSGEHSDS